MSEFDYTEKEIDGIDVTQHNHTWDLQGIEDFDKARCVICNIQNIHYGSAITNLQCFPESEKKKPEWKKIVESYQKCKKGYWKNDQMVYDSVKKLMDKANCGEQS